jgi:hypothetical protein
MAGENRGKAVEVVVRLAIQGLLGAGLPKKATVVWDDSAPPLAWKPDIFVSPQGRFPGLLVLVTFSGSETDSRQKFWRNLCEYFDARTKIPSICAVSVLAGARVRERLLETQNHIFNGVVQLEDLADPKLVAKWLSLLTRKGMDPEALLVEAQGLAKVDGAFRRFVATVGQAIRDAIGAAPSLDPTFWSLGGRTHVRLPGEHAPTHYRRGVAKSLLFDDQELTLLKLGKKLPRVPRHAGLVRAGILSQSLAGSALVDEEVRFAVSCLPNLSSTLKLGVTDVGVSARQRLWELGGLESALHWCRDNWVICSDKKFVARKLQENRAGQPTPHIFYAALKATLAIRLGKQGQAWLEDAADQSGEMRSILVGLILPKFERGAAGLPAHVAKAVAEALSKRTAKCSALSDKDIDSAMSEYVSGEIENRLVCHGIDAVETIVCDALSTAGIAWQRGRLPSGLAERLGYPERDLGTGGIVAGSTTFVHWKTVTDQGRDHKVKELFARGYQGKRQWGGNTYRRRELKCLLVVDGTWGKEDFQLLTRDAWDGVFYADEMVELVKAIV